MLHLEAVIGQREMEGLEVVQVVLGLEVMEVVIMVDLKLYLVVIQPLVVQALDLIIQDQVRIILQVRGTLMEK